MLCRQLSVFLRGMIRLLYGKKNYKNKLTYKQSFTVRKKKKEIIVFHNPTKNTER